MQAQEISREIAAMVRDNHWEKGQVLPSLRELSRRYNVSHETVRRALQELEDRGLVTKVHGLGTLVNGGVPEPPLRSEFDDSSIMPTASVGSRALSVATCEYAPEKRPVWEQLGRQFEQLHPGSEIRLGPLPGDLADARIDSLPDIIYV